MAKQNNNKITLYIAIAVVAIGIYLLIKKKKKEKEEGQANNNASSNNATTQTPKPKPKKCDGNMKLSIGTRTDNWGVTRENGDNCNLVQWCQSKINQSFNKGNPFKIETLLVEDGIFGKETEKAFQKVLKKKEGSWRQIEATVNSKLPKK